MPTLGSLGHSNLYICLSGSTIFFCSNLLHFDLEPNRNLHFCWFGTILYPHKRLSRTKWPKSWFRLHHWILVWGYIDNRYPTTLSKYLIFYPPTQFRGVRWGQMGSKWKWANPNMSHIKTTVSMSTWRIYNKKVSKPLFSLAKWLICTQNGQK